MKRPSNPQSPSTTIQPRAYRRLLAQEELDAAEDRLAEKRWEALEWMRMKGLDILSETKEDCCE